MNIPWRFRLALAIVGGLGALVAMQGYVAQIRAMPSATSGPDALLGSLANVVILAVIAVAGIALASFVLRRG